MTNSLQHIVPKQVQANSETFDADPKDAETLDNDFVIEKNVRKAIKNLEVLASKIIKKDISDS